MNTAKNITSERHATWLELFFDLVFVVAISALSHTFLAHNLSWHACGFFVFLFVPVWWTWMKFSYYIDQFELTHHWQRAVLFIAMFVILSLAVAVPGVFHHQPQLFSALYILLSVLLILLYIIAWIQHPMGRPLLSRYTVGFVLGAIIWGGSLWMPVPICFVVWGVALFVEMMMPLVAYLTVQGVPVQISHMDERFGLFTLIVLGDTIVSVALGIKDLHWAWIGLFNCIAGFVVAIVMWASYFDSADTAVIHNALRGGKNAICWSFVYGYSHFFVFVSMVAFGVGVYATVMPHVVAQQVIGGLLFVSAAFYLIGTFCIRAAAAQSFLNNRTVIKLSAILLVGVSAILTWQHLAQWAIPLIACVLLLARAAEAISCNIWASESSATR